MRLPECHNCPKEILVWLSLKAVKRTRIYYSKLVRFKSCILVFLGVEISSQSIYDYEWYISLTSKDQLNASARIAIEVFLCCRLVYK